MKKSDCEDEAPLNIAEKPLLLVLSGPSGAGKDAVLCRMEEMAVPFSHIITATTRPRRPAEKDGVNYHFIPEADFRQMIERQELLEYANVYGNWYGVPKAAVKEALDRGEDVILKVDIQGADSIKKLVPQAVSIFIVAPSMQELNKRLKGRNTESEKDMELRLQTAIEEMEKQHQFDYVVVNHPQQLDCVVDEIKAIITAEKRRITPREYNL